MKKMKVILITTNRHTSMLPNKISVIFGTVWGRCSDIDSDIENSKNSKTISKNTLISN